MNMDNRRLEGTTNMTPRQRMKKFLAREPVDRFTLESGNPLVGGVPVAPPTVW